jgi:hypothetical protein
MKTATPSSSYASLRVEGDILFAEFQANIDGDLPEAEWLEEAKHSVQDWLFEHREVLTQTPNIARLIRGELIFEFPINNQGKLLGIGISPLRTESVKHSDTGFFH